MCKSYATFEWHLIKITFVAVVLLAIVNNVFSDDLKQDKELTETLRLMDDAELLLQEFSYPNTTILIFGTTNSYKTILVKVLLEDPSLIAVADDQGSFKIQDEDSSFENYDSNIYPTILGNDGGENVFYICPDFGLLTSSSKDIARTFVMHRLTDRLNSVKLVIVVDYSHVLDDCDANFIELVNHLSSFVLDILKYKTGILLVVTNVENNYDEGELSPNDEILIESIKESFNRLISRVVLKDSKNETNAFIQAIKILKNNIALLRQPDGEGKVIDLLLIHECKAKILDAVEKIDLIQSSASDFGYSISESSKSATSLMLSFLAKKINSITFLVFKIWNQQNSAILQSNLNISAKFQIFKQNLLALTPVAKLNNNDIKITKNFTDAISNAILMSYGIDIDLSYSINLGMYGGYVEFFEEVSKRSSKDLNLNSANELNILLSFTDKYSNWYGFLQVVFDYVFSFEGSSAQKHVLQMFPELQKASPENFPQMFELLESGKLSFFLPYKQLQTKTLNNIQFDEFMEIFLFVVAKCVLINETGYIFGDIINVQVDLKLCNKEAKSFYILATTVVYLNSILELGFVESFSIVSPIVEVVNSTEISLVGSNGSYKAEKNGMDGEKGDAGVQGGNFIILTGRLKGASNLKIKSVGGSGGTGQNAGKILFTSYDLKSKSNIPCEKLNENRTYYDFSDLIGEVCWRISSTRTCYHEYECFYTSLVGCEWFFEVIGHKGPDIPIRTYPIGVMLIKCCGIREISNCSEYVCVKNNRQIDLSDSIMCSLCPGTNIYDETKKTPVHVTLTNCRALNGGDGGDGGAPGSVKVLVFVKPYGDTETVHQAFGYPNVGGVGKNFHKSFLAYNGIYEGKNGVLGGFPENSFKTRVNLNEDFHVFSNFTMPLLSNFNTDAITDFYFNLSENEEMVQMSGTYNLLKEALYFFRFFDQKAGDEAKILAETFYKTLNQKILLYSKTMIFNYSTTLICENNGTSCSTPYLNQVNESTTGYRKVVSWLYTSILSKISNLKHSRDNDLVINNRAFLENAASILGNLLEERWQKEISDRINETTSAYKKKLTNKIQEAESLIKNEIFKEVFDLNEQLEFQIEQLNEIIKEKIRKAVNLTKAIQESQKELKEAINNENYASWLKFIGSFLQVYAPLGQILGNIFETTATITQGTQQSSQEIIVKLKELQSEVQSGLDALVEWQNTHNRKQLLAFNREIDTIYNLAQNLSSANKNVKNEINILKKQYDLVGTLSPVNFTELRLTRMKIVNVVEEFTTVSRKRLQIPIDDLVKLALEKAVQMIKLAEAAFNLYLSYKNGELSKEFAAEVLKMSDAKIKLFLSFQSKVYSFVYPMMDDMTKALKKYNGTQSTESLTSISVSSWKLHTKIGDIRHEVTTFAKAVSVSVEKEIDHVIKKIDEAMEKMMEIYQRMEQYNEDKVMLDHLAFLANPGQDSGVSQNVNNLLDLVKKHAKTGNAIWFYNKAVNSIKLYAFPFAHKYVQGYDMTTKMFQIENDTDGFISEAQRHILKMIDTISVKNWLIDLREGGIFKKTYFKYNPSSTVIPFMTWNSEKYQDDIDSLLAGNTVNFYSDIFNGLPMANVVKYRTAHLSFRARDESISKNFTAELNKFWVVQQHSGYNYFQCGNDFYVIQCPEVKVEYTFGFKDNIDYIPEGTDGVYDSMANGDYLYSPYTKWAFRLKPSFNADIKNMSIFIGEKIDMFLGGHGAYIDVERPFPFNEYKVNSYYQSDEVLNKRYKESTKANEVQGKGKSIKVVTKRGQPFLMRYNP